MSLLNSVQKTFSYIHIVWYITFFISFVYYRLKSYEHDNILTHWYFFTYPFMCDLRLTKTNTPPHPCFSPVPTTFLFSWFWYLCITTHILYFYTFILYKCILYMLYILYNFITLTLYHIILSLNFTPDI